MNSRRIWRLVLLAVGVVVISGILWVLYLRLARGYTWAEFTGFGAYTAPNGGFQRAKTLWDWLDLLIVPVTLALLTVFFNWRQNLSKQAIANDNLKEMKLQEYLERISTLLLEKGLREAPPGSEPCILADAYTQSAFRSLDAGRKKVLLLFLYEAELIVGDSPTISLELVDLTGMDLRGEDLNGICLVKTRLRETKLTGAYLARANLSEANLSGADLAGAYLDESLLVKADLSGVNLRQAQLPGADLTMANLERADLTGADLSKANLQHAVVTPEQLRLAGTLHEATLPNG